MSNPYNSMEVPMTIDPSVNPVIFADQFSASAESLPAGSEATVDYGNYHFTFGIRVRYNGQLYRCEQAHTSQEDWTPDATPALWTAVAEPGEIPVWIQPTGAQDAYRMGDKVHYPTKDDPVYVSTIDYNTYAPDVYGWEREE